MSAEALGAILGYTGSIIGAAAQTEAVRQTNLAQRELAQYSFDQQRQMIAEQNAYNSPVSQMARYQEAGLNPNLIYGNISQGNQSEIAKYQAPQIQTPDVSGFGTGLADAARLALQFKQAEADLRLKDEQAYSQKMLGLGYQQDYYQKFLDNLIKSEVVGVNPGLVLSGDELDSLRKGRALQRYDAETQSVKYGNALKQAQTSLASFSAKHQQAIIDNLIPAQARLFEARANGQDVQNEILEIERDLNRNLEKLGGKGGVKLIIDFLRMLLK